MLFVFKKEVSRCFMCVDVVGFCFMLNCFLPVLFVLRLFDCFVLYCCFPSYVFGRCLINLFSPGLCDVMLLVVVFYLELCVPPFSLL